MSAHPGGEIHVLLRGQEPGFLSNLVRELRLLVAAPPQYDDPLATWEAELGTPALDHADPVVARLFPPGFQQPDLDGEYHRLTEKGLRAAKDDDAQAVLADLADAGGRAWIAISADRTAAWLRTLTALRLALAARLGVETAAQADALEEVSPRDPRHDLAQVYFWLGYLLETILADL